MVFEKQRTYIIPLRKEWLKVPKYRRSKKTVTAIRGFISKHMKNDVVKIGGNLNKFVLKHGRENPPHKVKVTTAVVKEKDKEYAAVELFGHEIKVKKEEEKKEGVLDKVKEKVGLKEEKKVTVRKMGKADEKKQEEIKEEEKLLKDVKQKKPVEGAKQKFQKKSEQVLGKESKVVGRTGK